MIPHESPRYWWKSRSPLVVAAWKFLSNSLDTLCKQKRARSIYGAVDPSRRDMLKYKIMVQSKERPSICSDIEETNGAISRF